MAVFYLCPTCFIPADYIERTEWPRLPSQDYGPKSSGLGRGKKV